MKWAHLGIPPCFANLYTMQGEFCTKVVFSIIQALRAPTRLLLISMFYFFWKASGQYLVLCFTNHEWVWYTILFCYTVLLFSDTAENKNMYIDGSWKCLFTAAIYSNLLLVFPIRYFDKMCEISNKIKSSHLKIKSLQISFLDLIF